MAPPGSSVLSSSSQVPPAPPRARPQARKRVNQQGDDAAYHGALPGAAVGTKRTAADKADGEPRVKRKRLEPAGAAGSSSVGAGSSRRTGDRGQDVEEKSVVSPPLRVGRVATTVGRDGWLDVTALHVCTPTLMGR